ncbi:hypothetical protein ACLOJK_008808 [Asimina triloba]
MGENARPIASSPVGENSTLNLVLADADGRVVWQTNTASKGVTGFQAPAPPHRLASPPRQEREVLVKELRPPHRHPPRGPVCLASASSETVCLGIEPEFVENQTVASFPSLTFGNSEIFDLVRTYYNAASSFPRIKPIWKSADFHLQHGAGGVDRIANEMRLLRSVPRRDVPSAECVACPRHRGMQLGWSESCAPPKLPSSCRAGAANYYRKDGVEHFMSSHEEGEGP